MRKMLELFKDDFEYPKHIIEFDALNEAIELPKYGSLLPLEKQYIEERLAVNNFRFLTALWGQKIADKDGKINAKDASLMLYWYALGRSRLEASKNLLQQNGWKVSPAKGQDQTDIVEGLDDFSVKYAEDIKQYEIEVEGLDMVRTLIKATAIARYRMGKTKVTEADMKEVAAIHPLFVDLLAKFADEEAGE